MNSKDESLGSFNNVKILEPSPFMGKLSTINSYVLL